MPPFQRREILSSIYTTPPPKALGVDVTSQVELANIALSKLGANPITSILDEAEEARAVRRFYKSTLRAELRSHPWNCARKRALLAALAEPPPFGFRYQYLLPADCVRILPGPNDEDWQVEGRRILSNDLALCACLTSRRLAIL